MPRVTIGLLTLATTILLSQVLPVGTSESLAVGPQGHPATNVGVGRFHSAVGYHNTAYHHSTWLQTTTGRPFLFQFEDQGGILPIHNVGLTASGRIPPGALGLHYVAEVGNGRTSRSPLNERVQNVLDENNRKAVNFAVFARPDAVRGLQAAISTYRDLADSLGIVVNRSNPVENLSFAELRKIFLGEQSHWSNGRRITVLMLEPGKQERQAVLTQIYRMDDKDFDKHFLQRTPTGEIHAAPKTLATSAEVLKFVFNVPGAIGYVRVTEADDSVKVVHVDSRLPGEKDYSIRLHPKSGKQ